jgi:hypothetical protein
MPLGCRRRRTSTRWLRRRRVTDSRAPEVDDGTQAAVDDEQVGGGEVSVDPDGRAVPCRREGCFPHLGCSVGVDLGVQGRDRLSGLAVIDGQWPAAKEVVLPGCRTACGIDLVQGGEEVGQVGGEPVEIRNSLHSRVLARKPPVHGPWPRAPAPRGRLSPAAQGWEGTVVARGSATTDAPCPPAGRTGRRSVVEPTGLRRDGRSCCPTRRCPLA